MFGYSWTFRVRPRKHPCFHCDRLIFRNGAGSNGLVVGGFEIRFFFGGLFWSESYKCDVSLFFFGGWNLQQIYCSQHQEQLGLQYLVFCSHDDWGRRTTNSAENPPAVALKNQLRLSLMKTWSGASVNIELLENDGSLPMLSCQVMGEETLRRYFNLI